MYYLYRHIRLDKNEPFYVGIGSICSKFLYSKSEKERYKRAYKVLGRSLHWKHIAEQSAYEVDIILESDNENYIKQKEKEFISLYGRNDLNKGCLCNFTDEGEGTFGRKCSENTKKIMSSSAKSRVERLNNKEELIKRVSKYWDGSLRQGENSTNHRKIIQVDTLGHLVAEYISVKEASIKTKTSISKITDVARGRKDSCKGFVWKYAD